MLRQKVRLFCPSYAVDEASNYFCCRLKERISYIRRVLEFSEPVDSEVDGRVWIQAYPLLNTIGGYTFKQQTFETYFFEGIGQDVGLSDDDGGSEVCSSLEELSYEEYEGHDGPEIH